MVRVLTIVEHQSISIVESSNGNDLSITHKQAALLEKIEHKLPKGSLSWRHKAVKFSQYCGLIRLGDLHFEILPKVYGLENEPGATRLELVKMLRKAGFLKAMPAGSASISTQKHTLLDIFIAHFCEQLKNALIQGMSRQYRIVEDNIGVLRGKLVTSQQLRSNLAHKERLYCAYDELSEDILLNQTIKFTLKLLLRLCRSSSIKQTLSQLLMSFDDVADKSVTIQSVDALILDRTNTSFHQVIDQCKMFIKGMNPDLYSGNFESFALLFDMNQLFEKWVASVMKPLAWQHGYQLREQGPKRYLAMREDIEKKVFQMKPDITLVDGQKNVVMIFDVKWKLLDGDDKKLGISQADLYQLNTYATQYGVKSVALVYPRQQGLSSSYKLSLLGENDIKVSVVVLDVNESSNSGKDNLYALIPI